jgi:hypothetical protein
VTGAGSLGSAPRPSGSSDSEWKPETAAQVRERVAEVIDLAGHDVFDLLRSRATEQEVLDLLDEPTTR